MKWLTFDNGVKKTPAIARSADLLDSYFENEPSIITSGLRTATDQIRIIREKAIRHKIENEFPEFTSMQNEAPDKISDDGLYWWQRTWSKLLSLGDIVNPPIAAKCLFDYINPKTKENKKGQTIQMSMHQRGLAFDIGGGNDLNNKILRVKKAIEERSCFITGFLEEKVNNACHIDVLQIS